MLSHHHFSAVLEHAFSLLLPASINSILHIRSQKWMLLADRESAFCWTGASLQAEPQSLFPAAGGLDAGWMHLQVLQISFGVH